MADTVGCVRHTLYLHCQRSGLFHGAQATGTNIDGFAALHSDLADIGLPCPVGFAVGMGYVLTEHNTLAADTALCHF